MDRQTMIALKIAASSVLVIAALISGVLAFVSAPIASTPLRIWGGVFGLSTLFFVAGVVRCWQVPEFPTLTMAALFYAVLLYGYVNLVAPELGPPFGFAPAAAGGAHP